jgi:hypothetical protein
VFQLSHVPEHLHDFQFPGLYVTLAFLWRSDYVVIHTDIPESRKEVWYFPIYHSALFLRGYVYIPDVAQTLSPVGILSLQISLEALPYSTEHSTHRGGGMNDNPLWTGLTD